VAPLANVTLSGEVDRVNICRQHRRGRLVA
jgi:hypothetical protein